MVFAGAVQPQDDHPGALVDRQVDVGEDLQRAVRLRQALRHQRGLAAGRGLGEAQLGDLVGLARLLQTGEQLLGAAGHVLRGDRLRRLGAHLVGLGVERGGLLLGVLPLAAAALLVGLALLLVELPAHVVDVDRGPVGVQVEHLVDDRLDQVDVVGDHDEAAAVGLQVVPQPDDGVGVEVVRRLVEEQGVRVGEQDAGELHAAALTAGEGVQRLAEHPVGEVERGGDRGGLGLGGVPALGEELGLLALVLLERLLSGGALAARDALFVLAHLADQYVEAAGGEDAVAGEDVEVAGAGVLGQVADLAGAGDRAGGGHALTGEDLGEGGLPRAVAADQADAVALGDAEGGAFDEDAGTGAQLDAGGGDHGQTPGQVWLAVGG